MSNTFASGSFPATANYTLTPVIPTNDSGSISFTWTGLNASDGTLQLEVADIQGGYNAFSDVLTLPAGSDTQIFQVLAFDTQSLRFVWNKGSNTAGSFTWFFEGV